MNKVQSYIYLAVLVLVLLLGVVFWADRQGKTLDRNEEPAPSIKPVAVVDTSITPPSVPEGKLLPDSDADGWGSYTNTRYGITFRNLRQEGHHVVTGEERLSTYEEAAYGMIIGLEDGMNPSSMVIAGGEAVYLCGLDPEAYPGYTYEEKMQILAQLLFKERIKLTTVRTGPYPGVLEGSRSEIVPIKIGTRTGYGFVTKDSYSECENTYVNKDNMTGVEIVYLFFENNDGSYIYITYPRNSRMAQIIINTFKFIR